MFKYLSRPSILIALVWLFLSPIACNNNGGSSKPSFVDPTATLINEENLHLSELNYVAPFAVLIAASDEEYSIDIGDETNVQDNCTLDATGGSLELGEQVIIAHGATVNGHASIGEEGTCPNKEKVCPSFVGFNAEVDGATIEKDAMVQHLARVGPGITIPSGCKVLPGKNITSQAEVGVPPDCNPPNTEEVVDADREFMEAVFEVNVDFAKEYTKLADEDEDNVTGINFDPGNTEFNPNRDLPTLNGVETRDPEFRNRIIGDVRMADTEEILDLVMGFNDSLRADEGEPFEVGSISSMDDDVTFHALEESHLQLGDNGTYSFQSIVHGGSTSFPLNGEEPKNTTITGDNFTLGEESVFFRSRIGDNSTVGNKSLVQQVDCPDGTIIGDHRVVIGDGTNCPLPGDSVEW